ncbi:MAG: cysteine synthase A [Clostridiales bacterium]|nr:cysteine synthase A [Clostridiales bacterium]
MLLHNITEMIGNTPLLQLHHIEKILNLNNNIFAKLEYSNPGSSIKDRAALFMIKNAKLEKGGTVIEATSGNTGIGLAIACKKYEYKLLIVLPENLSKERIVLLKALGATLILTKKEAGIEGAIKKAKQLNKSIKNSIYINQFYNENNSLAHYKTTAKEILIDLDGKVDCFVSAVGSGGTITGCGKYFKEQDYKTTIVAVEPLESAVLSGMKKGEHGIQGIGAGFIPEILDVKLIDKIIKVKTKQAYEMTQLLSKEEGVIAGLSAGAALSAVLEIDKFFKNKNIVFIVPDTGERYLSVGIYEDNIL